MTYELAKQLKDAGFPESKDSAISGKSVTIDDWTSPNLSELIEACGDRFDELSKMKHSGDIHWAAHAYPCEECGWEELLTGRGKTPEESVARLWLALNQKGSRDEV